MKNMNYVLLLLFFLLLSCNEGSKNDQQAAYKALPASTEFDVVILNGRVMDPETNFDGVRNVGIKDGIIAL
ncbi:MAG: D-glutamate deacylase, partial [Verrucomicrobiae bacterium]|nr:D-glutamate deacylase [Verrucomicrobiae bacterium]